MLPAQVRGAVSAFYFIERTRPEAPFVSTLNGEMLKLEEQCNITYRVRDNGLERQDTDLSPEIAARIEAVNDEIIRLEDEMALRFAGAVPSDTELLKAHADLVTIHVDLLEEIAAIAKVVSRQNAPLRLVKSHDDN